MRGLAVLLAGVFCVPQAAFARVNYRRLLKDLPQAAASERPLMIRAIGRSRRKKAAQALLARFEDRSLAGGERIALAAALGDLGYAQVRGPLAAEWKRLLDLRFSARSLPEEEERLRAALVAAVAKTAKPGDQEALAVMRRGVLDDERRVVLAAIEGIGRLRDFKSFGALRTALRGEDGELSRAAARALAALGDERSEKLLREGLESKNARARIDAALALGLMKRKIGVLTLDGFLEEVAGPYGDGVAAAGGLAELGRTNGLAYLGAVLENPESKLLGEAIDALGASGEVRAILPLAALLQDPRPPIRLRAIRALERIGGDRAAFELRRRRADAAPEVRRSIRETRSRLGDYAAP